MIYVFNIILNVIAHMVKELILVGVQCLWIYF